MTRFDINDWLVFVCIFAIVVFSGILLYAGNRISYVHHTEIEQVIVPEYVNVIKEVNVTEYINRTIIKTKTIDRTKDVIEKKIADCIKIESDTTTILDCGESGIIRWK